MVQRFAGQLARFRNAREAHMHCGDAFERGDAAYLKRSSRSSTGAVSAGDIADCSRIARRRARCRGSSGPLRRSAYVFGSSSSSCLGSYAHGSTEQPVSAQTHSFLADRYRVNFRARLAAKHAPESVENTCRRYLSRLFVGHRFICVFRSRMAAVN